MLRLCEQSNLLSGSKLPVHWFVHASCTQIHSKLLLRQDDATVSPAVPRHSSIINILTIPSYPRIVFCRRLNALNASLFDSKPVLSIRGKGTRLQFVFNTNLMVVNPDLVPPVPARVEAPGNPVMAMAKTIDGSPTAPPATGPNYPQGGVQMGGLMPAVPPPGMVNPYAGAYSMPPTVPGGYPGVGPYAAHPTADGQTMLQPTGGVIAPGAGPVYVDTMGNPITYPVGGGGFVAPAAQVYTGPQVFVGGGTPHVFVGGGTPQVFVPGGVPTVYAPGM